MRTERPNLQNNEFGALFHKVQEKRASEVVFEELEERILCGDYLPGEKLPSERQLMKIYARSHPTIREALRLLESARYIRVIPGIGAIVQGFDESMLREPLAELLRFRKASPEVVTEYLAAVEPRMADLAVRRCTDGDLRKLDRVIAVMRTRAEEMVGAQNADEFMGAGKAFYCSYVNFHIGVAASTHNQVMLMLWKNLTELLDLDGGSFSGENALGNIPYEVVDAHEAIVQALRRRDAEETAARIRRGIAYRKDIIGLMHAEEMRDERKETTRASVSIYGQIRQLILDGRLAPGERLPSEQQMMQLFGKSRAAIREALKMLEMKNYVTIRRGSGTVVNEVGTGELERVFGNLVEYNIVKKGEFLELRRINELQSALWASVRWQHSELEALKSVLRVSEQYLNDREKFILSGIWFSNEIGQCAHNEVARIVTQVTSWMQWRLLHAAQPLDAGEEREILQQHSEILQAIESHDAEWTYRVIDAHRDRIEQILEA